MPAAAQTEPRLPWPRPPRKNFSTLHSSALCFHCKLRSDGDKCSMLMHAAAVEFEDSTSSHLQITAVAVALTCCIVQSQPPETHVTHRHTRTTKLRPLQVGNQRDDASRICPHENSTRKHNAS